MGLNLAKVLVAECNNQGKVTSEGFELPEAVVLSEGKQQSQGLVLIDAELVRYLTSNASDIKTALEKVSAGLQQVADAIQALDSASVKSVSGSGVSFLKIPLATTGQVSQINSIKGEIDQLKDALK